MAKNQTKQTHNLRDPQRLSRGFKLMTAEESDRPGTGQISSGLFLTAVCLYLICRILESSDLSVPLSEALNTPPVIFLGLFGACGLVMASLGFLKLWTSPRLYPAELVLPDYPLLLGETYLVRYRRRLRNSTLRRPAHIKAQLTCEEWVKYSQGSRTVTKTHELWKQPLSERDIIAGERQIDYREEVEIRSQYPPSCRCYSNQVRWLLTIELKISGSPHSYRSVFYLDVLPEVVTR